MKKLVVAGFLLAGIMGAKAQVSVILKNATPQASTTIAGGNSVIVGDGAGNAVLPTATSNVFVGFISGMSNTTGADNTFVGWGAASGNTTGGYNTIVGRSAGGSNTTAFYNTFVGAQSGFKNSTGPGNTFIGSGCGYENISGGNNVVTGFGAGAKLNSWGNAIYGRSAGANAIGDGNVLVGQSAGSVAVSGNVMIGSGAGETAAVSNQLYIANSNTTTPLIWGDFATSKLKFNAKVNIGSNPFPTNSLYSTYQLFVKGGILTDEVRVALSTATGWADYVFAKDYNLKPLSEVEAFINTNGHLPNVPSAAEVKQDGIALGDMSRIQQEKIEELTLYIIAQNKRIEALEAKMNNK